MVFGRCFEEALDAYFCREDSAPVLFKELEAYRDAPCLTPHYILNVSGRRRAVFLPSHVTERAGRKNETQRKDGGGGERVVPLSGRRFS